MPPTTTKKEIEQLFEHKGCVIIGNIINSSSKVTYRCHCGKISSIKPSKFKMGKIGCSSCGRKNGASKRAYTFKFVKEYFTSVNCVYLESTYVNSHKKINYICQCGNKSKTTFSMFKSGSRCRKCSTKNRLGEKNPNWNPNREEVRINNILAQRTSTVIRRALRSLGLKKEQKTFKYLGYSVEDLKNHLEKFKQWDMLKEKEWHLDHIFPIKAFIDFGVTNLKLINCLENLQPLTIEENVKKNKKYDKDKFSNWLNSKLARSGS